MNNQKRTIGVSTPGGLAKQFRIQFRTNDSPKWRQSNVSTTQSRAEQIAAALQSKGMQVRVVHYSLPTAA